MNYELRNIFFYRVTVLSVLAVLLLPGIVFAIDTDRDGLSDEEESYYHTNPENVDTDGDGYYDGVEVEFDYSPHIGDNKRMNEYDYDGDGLNDWVERWFGSDIGEVDTDGDGRDDFDEVMTGLDPKDTTTTEKFEKRIEVDRTHQRLYYFVDNIKIMNYPVSTGNPSTPTPAGDFEIFRRLDIARYVGVGYDLPGVKWNMEFKPQYFIHSAYWHNYFGIRTYSHGCVNMRLVDAEILYKYAGIGTKVTVTGMTPQYWVR